MHKSFNLTCKNDLMNLIGKESFENSVVGEYDFSTYRYGDSELPIVRKKLFGDDSNGFKIERRVSLTRDMANTDVGAFAEKTPEELDKLIEINLGLMQDHYRELQKEADKLQMELLYTAMLMRIRERAEIKPVMHTNNQWVRHDTTEYEYRAERSNMVYRMYYRVYMEHPWDAATKTTKKNGVCRLYWCVTLNAPITQSRYHISIASQEKKFKTEEEMQKYLEGRIKAYDKYFVEISPPIPHDLVPHFTHGGQLLPGYREEEEGV